MAHAERHVEITPGQSEPLSALLVSYRPRLARLVELRMDPRLRSRLDASDILQEAFLEVVDRLEDWNSDRRMPFFVWVRYLAVQRLSRAHRDHLGTEKRDAAREVGIEGAPEGLDASSIVMAREIADSTMSPSGRAAREDETSRVRAALDQLKPADREILALRHYEQLSNQETTAVLGLSESAVSGRYLRALERLRKLLEAAP